MLKRAAMMVAACGCCAGVVFAMTPANKLKVKDILPTGAGCTLNSDCDGSAHATFDVIDGAWQIDFRLTMTHLQAGETYTFLADGSFGEFGNIEFTTNPAGNATVRVLSAAPGGFGPGTDPIDLSVFTVLVFHGQDLVAGGDLVSGASCP